MNETKKLWVAVAALAVGLVGIYWIVFSCPTYGKDAGACAVKSKSACASEREVKKSCCSGTKAAGEDHHKYDHRGAAGK